LKLAAAILGVPLFGGGALPAQYYPSGISPPTITAEMMARHDEKTSAGSP